MYHYVHKYRNKYYVIRTTPSQSFMPKNCGIEHSKNLQRCHTLCKCYLQVIGTFQLCLFSLWSPSLCHRKSSQQRWFTQGCCLLDWIAFLHQQFPNEFFWPVIGYHLLFKDFHKQIQNWNSCFALASFNVSNDWTNIVVMFSASK